MLDSPLETVKPPEEIAEGLDCAQTVINVAGRALDSGSASELTYDPDSTRYLLHEATIAIRNAKKLLLLLIERDMSQRGRPEFCNFCNPRMQWCDLCQREHPYPAAEYCPRSLVPSP
jgi:hypothetical protein